MGIDVLRTNGSAPFLAGIHLLSVEPNRRMTRDSILDGVAERDGDIGPRHGHKVINVSDATPERSSMPIGHSSYIAFC